MLKDLLVEGINRPICRPLRQWWWDHQLASSEDLAHKAEPFTDVKGHKLDLEHQLDSKRAESLPKRGRVEAAKLVIDKSWISNNHHRQDLQVKTGIVQR